jgi:hypothetical protein
MKTKISINTFVLSVLVIFLFSCKTAEYSQSTVLSKKLPALQIDFDWLSIESSYPEGSSVSNGVAYKSGYGTVTANSASVYYKNPQINYVKNRLTQESYNICDKFGKTYGTIKWSVNQHSSKYCFGVGGWVSGLTLTIPIWFGMPIAKYVGVSNLTANIYDSNNYLIASYSSEKVKSYSVALWWGYSGNTANSMAFNNSFTEAVYDIETQISKDQEALTKLILNKN